MTATLTMGTFRFASTTGLAAPEALDTLQHEWAGIGILPQSGPMVRQHSASVAVNMVPGIRQTMVGANSDVATSRPMMKCVRLIASDCITGVEEVGRAQTHDWAL